MLGLVGVIAGSIAVMMFPADRTPLPLAAAEDYRVERADCWEQDLFNTSSDIVTFEVEAVLGDDQLSEVLFTGALRPGDGEHLHFFSQIWDQKNFENGSVMHFTAVAEELGCELTVRIAPTATEPTGQLLTDRYHNQ